MGDTLPRTYAEIHRRALDARGRRVQGPLPMTIDEIHSRSVRGWRR